MNFFLKNIFRPIFLCFSVCLFFFEFFFLLIFDFLFFFFLLFLFSLFLFFFFSVCLFFLSFFSLSHPSPCEGGGDVVGVVTPLVGGVAQAFHGDQVVELRVQLAVQEVEGKEEDRKGQVEVEEGKRLKEVRSWMTMEMFMTRLRS